MAQEPESTAKRTELPMRLTRLRVKNFRSIADIDIPLSPLTVLVGPNGSGKSNVVDALRFVRDVFARGLDQAVMDREGMGVIQRWGTEGIEIGITLEIAEIKEEKKDDKIIRRAEPPASFEYDFTFSASAFGGTIAHIEAVKIYVADAPSIVIVSSEELLTIGYGEMQWDYIVGTSLSGLSTLQNIKGPEGLLDENEHVFFDDEDWVEEYKKEEGYSWRRNRIAATRLEEALKEMLFYTLNSADLRQPQQTLKESPFDEKGRNLAAVLRRLANTGGMSWRGMRFALHQAVAGFDTYGVESVGGYLVTKLIYNSEGQFRSSYIGQESDGTIRMLGILAALLQEPAQPFISIEEPEANIHPGALAVLAGVIDEASLRSQILVTTHSPDMLDHLPVESFLVVEKVGDTTHVGPLDASQIASVRKRLFTPGELFRMEGLQRQTESAS